MLYRQLLDKAQLINVNYFYRSGGSFNCRRSAHETYKTQSLSTIILFGILIMTLLAFGCSKTGLSGSALEPKGFRTSKSLSHGFDGSYSPNDNGKVFLVITVAVPTKELIPTEAEYLKIEPKFESRENCRILNHERFTVILVDGRRYHGELIAFHARENVPILDFSPYMISWQMLENEKTLIVTNVDVAFVVDEKDAKPPFRIQLDRQTPVAVPEKKMEKSLLSG